VDITISDPPLEKSEVSDILAKSLAYLKTERDPRGYQMEKAGRTHSPTPLTCSIPLPAIALWNALNWNKSFMQSHPN
jgi:hypothetical protein